MPKPHLLLLSALLVAFGISQFADRIDPYFLDVASPDAEGDCPVLTAMSGTDNWKSKFCASTFATFLQILAIGMEVAKNFPDGGDVEDEQVFREALGPRIRQCDPAAAKAGHWT